MYRLRLIVNYIILFYQKTLSQDHGLMAYYYPYGYCRFYPSCSEYVKQAVFKYGIIKGCALGVIRIIKCNPISKPSIDKP